MKETREYLVPDYYSSFSCKMGACRTACCTGWPVSITMDDYFRLLGIECSSELRLKLDTGLHISRDPHPEDYAQISQRYDGDCKLRASDGLCLLHAELGEDSLPCICRLYPRAPRTEGSCECSCTNSCERVVELLAEQKTTISFLKQNLTFELPAAKQRSVTFETVGREQEIRLHFINTLQKREYPLPVRLMLLRRELTEMEKALDSHDEALVDKLLSGGCIPQVFAEKLPNWAHLQLGLEAARRMVERFDEGSQSIRDYGEAALAYFGEGESAFGRYAVARAHFDSMYPDWEIMFENLLVNHMFFSRFPFQDRPVSLSEEFMALCAVYSLLRFLSIGWMADKSVHEALVDVIAAAFRLIEHTAFDRYAVPVLRSVGCTDTEKLYELILL